jgi:hypothetical protein
MAQNIGINAPTRIPTFSDDASIEEALKKYHYGIDNWNEDPVQNDLGVDGNFKTVKDRLTAAEAAIASIIGEGGGFVQLESKTTNPNTITPQTSTVVPLTIRGVSGQTANLQRWQNSSSTNLAIIFSNGSAAFNSYLTVGTNTQSSTTGIDLRIGNAVHRGITVRAASSQTANLQEWQNSSGVAMSWITSNGALYVQGNEIGPGGLGADSLNSFLLMGA